MADKQPERQIILASGSPRRAELLEATGVPFTVIVPHVNEDELTGETPKSLVERLSLLKANEVAKDYPEAWIIGADTTVCCNGAILGKPLDAEHARSMLRTLQGEAHSVWSAFALVNQKSGVTHVESHETVVEMVAIPDALIDRYVGTGEPLDKAGAYAIQETGARFISAIRGSYTNVVGLNVASLMQVLKRYGVYE